jgi:hypothetical protein
VGCLILEGRDEISIPLSQYPHVVGDISMIRIDSNEMVINRL